MNRLAVVIPAYNESSTIREVTRRALAQCKHVIVVDDGSTDRTADVIADLPIVLLRNEKNCGKAASLWRGMQYAMEEGMNAVITLDADGQHRPEDIPRFQEIAHKYPGHIVIGSRMSDRHLFPRRRYYANRVANFWISWAAGYRIKDSQSGFRLYPASLLRHSKLHVGTTHGFVFESEILIEAARLGVYSLTLPIAAIYSPNSRASHFRPVLDIARITRMVGWKLLSRGLYPWGLLKALFYFLPKPRLSVLGADGVATLLLSNAIILMTGGISLWWQLGRVYRVAKQSPINVPASAYYLVFGMRLRNGVITQDYVSRLERAKILYTQNPQGKIIVLGGVTQNGSISEARAGKDFLVAAGIPETIILTEDRSRNTLENLRQARAMLSERLDHRYVLITNRFHMARCHALSSGLGMPHYLCAAENRFSLNLRVVLQLLREAYYLHWYVVGRGLSVWTANRSMLDKIT